MSIHTTLGNLALTIRALLFCLTALSLSLNVQSVDGAEPARPGALAEDRPSEEFRFRDDKGRERVVQGTVRITAQDGGLLVLGRDGTLCTIEPAQLIARQTGTGKFSPLAPAELGKEILKERGAGFQVLTTKHYVLCFNTSREYAQWCGALFERLFAGFYNFWKQRGIELHEPEFPLVALIFADEKQYAAYSSRDVGPEEAAPYGYYFSGSNRVVLYDQTASGGKPARSLAEIQRRFAASPANIATVVHEATHQIAFNSGLHTRYADNPLWLTEGMAMYFEAPDLQGRTGWKTIGAVNSSRLKPFRASLARRPAGSLVALIQSDALFTTQESQGAAYAEAWALTYFLIRTRKDAYVTYLKKIAAKPVLTWDQPAQRLADFREAFGDDLPKLEGDFLRYFRNLP